MALNSLPNWEQLVSLVDICLFIDADEASDYDYTADYCTPIIAALFEHLGGLQTVQFLEFIPGDQVVGQAFITKRNETQGTIKEWDLDNWVL